LKHPHGASKARFFAQFGYHTGAWEDLAAALLEHGRAHAVARVTQTPFGPRYEVEGAMAAPDGRSPRIRTVWQ
jgi:hypothetical protein